MINDVPSGLEAHKLINISLGKIAASRSGRTGASLHKSLLVASVLHKARYVYLEEAHHYHHAIFCPPQGQPDEFVPEPPRAPTPLPEVTVTPVMSRSCTDKRNNAPRDNDYPNVTVESVNCISDECKSRLQQSDSEHDSDSEYDSDDSLQSRKRRRVSDQETEAAVSSILPKRLKSEIESVQCTDCYYKSDPTFKCDTKIVCTCGYELSSCQCAEQPSDDDVCNMEVDHITSLVSIFSFNQQQQQQADRPMCSTQVHHQVDAVGPPVLALTA